MILRWLPLALFAIVLAPSVLHAQPQSVKAKITYLVDAEPNCDTMYEDIEIMRRILDRKLQPLYQRVQYTRANPVHFAQLPDMLIGVLPCPTNDPHILLPQAAQPFLQPNNLTNYNLGFPVYSPNPQNTKVTLTTEEVGFSSLEGVYLKDQGIVYTATLHSLQSTAKAEKAKKPISEWESIRRQLRNEKEEAPKPEASKPPSLSEVLLKVLAENGHNLSQLGENESLTIILTVHDASPSSTTTKSRGGSAKTESKPAAGDVVSGLRAEVRDSELLGELHLKQGKHGEAIKAFHYVLTRISDPKHEAELHRKLAQCYLMQGQDEKARAELDQAIALLKKETEAKAKPAPPAKPALPVKLIISAPKKLLDQVKEGKITFEEFRRQAHVETLRFDDRR